MDSVQTTDPEPARSDDRHPKRRPTLPVPPSVDLSMQSNTTVAGRDVVINIAAEVPHRDPPIDTRILANWVSPLNHHKFHKDIVEKVMKGTGSWIFEHPKYKDWLSKKTNILWGTGIPGAGKTCITSVVVEHLIKDRQATVVYIYCQYNDQLSPPDILACMLKQMIERSPAVAQYVSTSLYKDCLSTETKPSHSELLTALRGAAQLFTDLFLVVDALDELRDDIRPELINNLISLQQPLFFTSRTLSDFPDLKQPDFTIRAPDDDFRTYISTKIASFPKLEPLLRGPGVRDDIITKIYDRCDGMFLLAALQVDALVSAGIIDAKGLRKAVEHLPTTLHARYELTLERIRAQNERERDLACRMIAIITHATRILQVDELLDALTIDIEAASVEEEHRTAEETLTGVCNGLVTIEKEKRTVQLIHYTAQEFFKGRKDTPVFSDPHRFIADASAIYLIHADIKPGSIGSEGDLQKTKASYPFLYYVCSNLGHHTYHASESGKDPVPEHVGQLFRKRPNAPLPLTGLGNYIDHGQAIHFASLYGLESLFEETHDGLDQMSALGCSTLFFACLGGHAALVDRITKRLGVRLQIGRPTKFGATPLHAACRSGKRDIVQLLLPMLGQHGGFPAGVGVQRLIEQTNVNINAKMLDGQTALHLASQDGYKPVVEALLRHASDDRGLGRNTDLWRPLHSSSFRGCWTVFQLHRGLPYIELNAKNKDGQTPLYMAARNGHEPVVQLLLNTTEIDVNARGNNGWTPLHQAASKGHESVAQLLLNSTGIEVNPKTNSGWTPLHLAALKGHESVAQLLLNSTGIEVNAREEDGWTPLYVAASKGHESVAQLLLNSTGIEVNPKSNRGWTPLHEAAQEGHESVAQLLLNSTGIEVNPKTNSGSTPLHKAAQEGHESVAQLLLNSTGIEVNPKTNSGSTPLHKAAQEGHESVAQLLLNSTGIEVNPKTNSGSTPLHKAALKGHESVAQLLLNSTGIEVNAREEDGWTPLYLAASKGHESVAQLLLNSPGIEVNSKSKDGSTPLHRAAQNGHEAVAQLLLNSPGIEVNSKSKDGSTPLHRAAQNGHESVAQLLLNSPGIEVNSKSNDACTPLHKAAQNGHESVAQLLLNSTNIEVNAKSKTGWTPLYLAAENRHEGVIQLLLAVNGIEARVRGQSPWDNPPLEVVSSKSGHHSVTFFRQLPEFPGVDSDDSSMA